jgi:misacylated tRNA(Ala) deacylase
MSEQICYADAYARSIEATVVRTEPSADGASTLVLLDRTVFYPGGGGQPADRGTLTCADGRVIEVEAAKRAGSEIVHQLVQGGEPPQPGERVTVAIDWPRRHLLMRTHTALHALSGVIWRDHGAQVTGGNMEPGAGRLDFELDGMSAELAASIEARLNEELAKELDVAVRVLPRAEAFAIPDLIRTKVNLLPEGIEEIRIIEIVGLDLQADGGTHVANTREVGPVRIAGYESKGKTNKRIRIALGEPALGDPAAG